jgi:hypothetical protein
LTGGSVICLDRLGDAAGDRVGTLSGQLPINDTKQISIDGPSEFARGLSSLLQASPRQFRNNRVSVDRLVNKKAISG